MHVSMLTIYDPSFSNNTLNMDPLVVLELGSIDGRSWCAKNRRVRIGRCLRSVAGLVLLFLSEKIKVSSK
jgi:hypothetical protein